MSKIKYKLIFMQHQYETLRIVGVKRLKELNKKIISFKGKKYPISVEQPTYISSRFVVYCFNITDGSQLSFTPMESMVSPEDLDIVVGQKIIRELTSGVMDNFKEKLGMIILGALLGGLTVAMILSIYYQGKIEEIYKEQINTPSVPIIPIVASLIRGQFKCL